MILVGDSAEMLRDLASGSVQTCVTSPPYWGLRDYGVEKQIGLEPTPDEYVARLVDVFREVRRVLKNDGTLWLNLGDSYNGYMANQRATSISANNQHAGPVFESGRGKRTAGLTAKDMIGIPWRVALALQSDGWVLRSDIIWAKPNPMPESVTDRPTKAHEYLFLLAKSQKYYYDADAIREPHTSDRPDMATKGVRTGLAYPQQGPVAYNSVARNKTARDPHAGGRRQAPEPGEANAFHPLGRNRRDVWTIATAPFPEAHFATFPPKLVEPCILAGSRVGDAVLDPFAGAGTTLLVAQRLGRVGVGIELNPQYAEMAERRLRSETAGLALDA